jgi:hypothetical protein
VPNTSFHPVDPQPPSAIVLIETEAQLTRRRDNTDAQAKLEMSAILALLVCLVLRALGAESVGKWGSACRTTRPSIDVSVGLKLRSFDDNRRAA